MNSVQTPSITSTDTMSSKSNVWLGPMYINTVVVKGKNVVCLVLSHVDLCQTT